jgi:hypothetical protein
MRIGCQYGQVGLAGDVAEADESDTHGFSADLVRGLALALTTCRAAPTFEAATDLGRQNVAGLRVSRAADGDRGVRDGQEE